jgi:coenzyme F420-0:L-glutamate ligase/coenzyme F420-1:gamma-L-glutamate ligase
VNRIGAPDLFGRKLEITEIAVADELAAAASFVMGQADEAIPAVLVRGAALEPSDEGMQALLRARERDLFRQ